MAKLIFHGHACFELVDQSGVRLLIDPFLADNPVADVGPEHFDRLDYLLLTHGHQDHVADAWEILRRTSATLISTYELVSYAQEKQGVENGHPMHIGGGWDFPFGRLKLTPALHGGMVGGEGGEGYTTCPAGLLLSLDGHRVYHAGDTALTMDMSLLRGQVDTALLPIGDNFTMGPEDAARAVEMIEPDVVVPMHYGTWELVAQDPERFRQLVGGSANVVVLAPGEALDL